jgi:hypothetical protein
MALWGIETCPVCEGSGWNYCEKCESACEHDRPCTRCDGVGEVPYKMEGMAAVAAVLAKFQSWPSKKARSGLSSQSGGMKWQPSARRRREQKQPARDRNEQWRDASVPAATEGTRSNRSRPIA